MQDLTAKRTLVKSPPELWSELSEVERLARHLGAFGEIKITRLEPERTVAWEGEGASGTVSIEPSGWGTKVVLTARIEAEEAAAPPAPEPEPEPEPEPAPEPSLEAVAEEPSEIATDLPAPPVRKRRWLGWLFGRERPEAVAEQPVWVAGAPAEAPAEEAIAPEPAPLAAEEPAQAAEPEPVAEPEPPGQPEPEPIAEPQPPANGDPAQLNPTHAQAALEDALEALGSAHHRPFSRG
jgi:hypothetical protein